MSEFERKILELLQNIDNKLDRLLGESAPVSKPAAAPALKPIAAPKEERPETIKEEVPKTIEYTSYVKPSEIAAKQVEEVKPKEEKEEEIPAVEGRRVCPNCGSTDFNQIEDKTKVLHQMAGSKIYAKKYICKRCGFEL